MYTINHKPSLYLYRLLRLTEDLRRIRSERDELKHTLRQDANVRVQQAGDRGNDQNSEIHKLKQELESTRRELDETRLRFFRSHTYVFIHTFVILKLCRLLLKLFNCILDFISIFSYFACIKRSFIETL